MPLFDDLETRITEKAGPLPVWAWVLVIGGGGYLAYRWYQSKHAASATAATTDTATQQDATNPAQVGPFYQVNYAAQQTPGVDTTSSSKATFVKNPRTGGVYSVVGNKLTHETRDTLAAKGITNPDDYTKIMLQDPLFLRDTKSPNPIYEVFGGTKVHLTPAQWSAAQKTEHAQAAAVKSNDPRLAVPNAADQILY